jgi:ParB/RepB/Spo0J family partition protein
MSTATTIKPTRRSGRHHSDEIVTLDLDRVVSRENCRKSWSEQDESFQVLLASIKKDGQDVPGISFYDSSTLINVVVDGQRRLRACQILGIPFKTIVLDHEPTEGEILDLQLRTFKRADTNQLDKARAYAQSMKLHGFTTNRELAEHHHESEATISKLLAVLDLPEEGQQKVADGVSIDRVLKDYRPKKRAKGHGKKRSLSLGKRRTILLTAQVAVEDELAIEMLQEALRIFTASKAIEDNQPIEPAELRIAAAA